MATQSCDNEINLCIKGLICTDHLLNNLIDMPNYMNFFSSWVIINNNKPLFGLAMLKILFLLERYSLLFLLPDLLIQSIKLLSVSICIIKDNYHDYIKT